MDPLLVADIARVLGAGDEEAARWAEWAAHLQEQDPLALPTTRVGRVDPLRPHAGVARRIDRAVASGGPVVITGMPGAGKTRLAQYAIARLADGRPVVSVDLRDGDGRGDARQIAEAIARALGGAPGAGLGDDDFFAATAELLAAARAAVLIDDLAGAAGMAPFANALAVPIAMVSRTRVDPREGWAVVDAEPWTTEEIADHLRTRIGSKRADAEPDALAALAAGAGGLPLAAELLAARIAQRPHWRLADHVAEADDLGTWTDEALGSSIELSYAALDDAARRALRLIAVAPSARLDVSDVAILLDADPSDAGSVVETLRRARLAGHGDPRLDGEKRPAPGDEVADPVTLTPLVRAFAAARSADDDPPSERAAAIDRLVDALLDDMRAAVAAQQDGAGDRFWDGRLDLLLDLTTHVADRRPEVPIEVSRAARGQLDKDGRHRTAERLHRFALGVAEREGDVGSIAHCALGLGQVLVRLGRPYAGIELQRAQQFAEQAGDDGLVVSAENALAIDAAQRGDAEESARRFSLALEAAERAGSDRMLPVLTDNLGIMLRRAGDLEGASRRHRRARELALGQNDRALAAHALSNLSDVQLALGDVDGAIVSAGEAVELTRDRDGLAHIYALTNHGLALAARGDADAAARRHREALALADRSGDASVGPTVRNNLAELLWRSAAYEEARSLFAEALGAASAVAQERARALAGLAEHDLLTGDGDAARARLAEAAGLFGEGDSPEAVRVRQRLADL